MLYKEYSDVRVCIIDFKPVFIKAVKNAKTFCVKSKIPFVIKNKDVKKLICHFLISDLCTVYTGLTSTYVKIYGIYDFDIDKDLKNILQDVLKILPIPHCKIESMDHPDAKYSAVNQINKDEKNYRQYKKFIAKNSLLDLQRKITKQNIFFKGVVDLSSVLD